MSQDQPTPTPRRRRHLLRLAACLAVAAAGVASAFAQEKTPVATPAAGQVQSDPVKRGQYLAIAADCAACHTVPGSAKLFAGGYAIDSPMGKIYSSNITPSKQYGIGNYTEAEFARAVREGVNAHGTHLYPAMPYPSYAAMTDEDVAALYAYFMQGVQPVDEAAPETRLAFPFNVRASMAGWNLLFLHNQRFAPDASKSAEWNRGKYLVDTLAHCAECHTPRNAMMALEDGAASYSGSQLGSWHAPNITSDAVSGLGGWSDAELAAYLKTGHVAGKAQAAGPMAEAVTNSLQHLTDADVRAIVAYLRTIPAVRTPGQAAPSYAQGKAADTDADTIGLRPMQVNMADMKGEELYANACASCHQSTGEGTRDGFYPSLAHNTAVGGASVDNLVAAILFGVDREAGGKHVLMPGFGPGSEVQALSDAQVASLANYVLQQFGNAALSVTAAHVAELREGGPTPALAKLAGPAVGIAVVIVLALVVLLLARRKRRARH